MASLLSAATGVGGAEGERANRIFFIWTITDIWRWGKDGKEKILSLVFLATTRLRSLRDWWPRCWTIGALELKSQFWAEHAGAAPCCLATRNNSDPRRPVPFVSCSKPLLLGLHAGKGRHGCLPALRVGETQDQRTEPTVAFSAPVGTSGTKAGDTWRAVPVSTCS